MSIHFFVLLSAPFPTLDFGLISCWLLWLDYTGVNQYHDKAVYLACFLDDAILAAAPDDDAVCQNVWVCQCGNDCNVPREGQTFLPIVMTIFTIDNSL